MQPADFDGVVIQAAPLTPRASVPIDHYPDLLKAPRCIGIDLARLSVILILLQFQRSEERRDGKAC